MPRLLATPTSAGLSLFKALSVCLNLCPSFHEFAVSILLVVEMILRRLPDPTDVIHLMVKGGIPGGGRREGGKGEER